MIDVTRKDLENQTYLRWLQGNEERPVFEGELRELLLQHSKAVCYKILRRDEPEVVCEASNRVLLALPTFDVSKSLFTTWAHAIISNCVYSQRRKDRQKKREFSVDIPGFDLPGQPSIGSTDLLLTVKETLSASDYQIFCLTILEGLTDTEAAVELKIPRSSLNVRVRTIREVLRNAFGKHLSNRGRSRIHIAE